MKPISFLASTDRPGTRWRGFPIFAWWLAVILVLLTLAGCSIPGSAGTGSTTATSQETADSNSMPITSPVALLPTGTISPAASTPSTLPVPTAILHLADVVEQTLNGRSGSWAIVIKNLKTGESYRQDPDREIFPASLFKLAVMVETVRQLHAGLIKPTDRVTVTAYMRQFNEGENNIPVGGTMSVEDALKAMITYSDNVAAQVLLARIGYDSVDPAMQKLGLTHTYIGYKGYHGPQMDAISADDAATLFEMIYNGTCIDQAASKQMLDLLLAQQINDRIPARLPKGTPVAHKTGNYGDVVHDAGIVYLPDGSAFTIAMLGYDLPLPGEATGTIAILSRAVYDYFTHPS